MNIEDKIQSFLIVNQIKFLIDHYLFDELWMSGHKKIPEKVFEEEKLPEKVLIGSEIEESKEVVN